MVYMGNDAKIPNVLHSFLFLWFPRMPMAYEGTLESNCKYTLFDVFENIGGQEMEIKIKMAAMEFKYYFFL